MAYVILDPARYGAKGAGKSSARADTAAFAKMSKVIRSNPRKDYWIRLRPRAKYCLGFGLDWTEAQLAAAVATNAVTRDERTLIAYRAGWLVDDLKHVKVGCDGNVSKPDWAWLKTTPGSFPFAMDSNGAVKLDDKGKPIKRTVGLISGGRTGPVDDLAFENVVLDGSALASNRTMDTQQSNLFACGTKGVTNLVFNNVIFRDAPADGVKTVAGTHGVTLSRVWAELMGRAAIVIQGGTSKYLIESCDGDDNFKAWLDAEPTSGDGPYDITVRNTKLSCGVTSNATKPQRRPDYAGSFAGQSPNAQMHDVLVEDSSLDSGLWLYNVRDAEFNRVVIWTKHDDVPGFKHAIHAVEAVEAVFNDCQVYADDMALSAEHRSSVGAVPSKLWFNGGLIEARDRVGVLDSAQGLWLNRTKVVRREPTAMTAAFLVTGSLIGQELTGFKFSNVDYDQSRALCEVRSKSEDKFDSIKFKDLEAEGCGPAPFILSGRTQNIEPPVVVP